MDRIDLFRVFSRVVECASYTRAADMLGMPRSSVSAAVVELEARVGVRLLHRTTRKVAPTVDGQAFYARCLRVIEDVEEAEALFRQSRPAFCRQLCITFDRPRRTMGVDRKGRGENCADERPRRG